MHLSSLKVKGPWVGILIRKCCYRKGQCDLDLWPLNAKNPLRSSSDQKQCICKAWRSRVHGLSSEIQGQCNLDLCSPVHKINRGHLLAKTNAPTKFEGQLVKLLIRNSFYIQGQCNIDLWPLDPKINRGHLLVMNNQQTKFGVPRPKNSLVIDLKLFLPTRSMWPWPLTLWPQKSSTGHEQSSYQVWSS
jgi:hypothetical protein